MDMSFKCPHCGGAIHLIGTKIIKQEFGLSANAIENRRKKGLFPDPVLDITNRLLWIREEVEEAMARETESKIFDFVKELERSLATLPEDEREKARELLAKELDGGTGS